MIKIFNIFCHVWQEIVGAIVLKFLSAIFVNV